MRSRLSRRDHKGDFGGLQKKNTYHTRHSTSSFLRLDVTGILVAFLFLFVPIVVAVVFSPCNTIVDDHAGA